MRESKPTFIADDGTEFDSKGECERYETLKAATEKLADVKAAFVRAFCGSMNTADGKPFTFNTYRFWKVQDSYGSMPCVVPVSLGYRSDKISLNPDNMLEFAVWIDPMDRVKGHWLHLRFDELYAEEKNANKACHEKMRARLAEMEEEVRVFQERYL